MSDWNILLVGALVGAIVVILVGIGALQNYILIPCSKVPSLCG